jgi:hypothetical protein
MTCGIREAILEASPIGDDGKHVVDRGVVARALANVMAEFLARSAECQREAFLAELVPALRRRVAVHLAVPSDAVVH